MSKCFPVRIASVDCAASDVLRLELHAAGGGPLPAFSAGAHIDLHLANGLVRSYSLLNDPAETHRYVVAVHRAPQSRGGSAYVHDQLRPGTVLDVTGPRNHFALDETAAHTVLIAGGIGITPLYAMLQRLESQRRSWQLYYCARTREHAALRQELQRYGRQAMFHFDQEREGKLLDLPAAIASAPPGSHFYCCGPLPMLAAFEAATAHLPAHHVHVEYFRPKEPAPPSHAHAYLVRLARSDLQFRVGPDETILDKLIELDVEIPYSCREGVCGSCEARVLEGVPEHRDQVLSQADREAGQSMMVCCSGCRGDLLVLDL